MNDETGVQEFPERFTVVDLHADRESEDIVLRFEVRTRDEKIAARIYSRLIKIEKLIHRVIGRRWWEFWR